MGRNVLLSWRPAARRGLRWKLRAGGEEGSGGAGRSNGDEDGVERCLSVSEDGFVVVGSVKASGQGLSVDWVAGDVSDLGFDLGRGVLPMQVDVEGVRGAWAGACWFCGEDDGGPVASLTKGEDNANCGFADAESHE